MGKTKTEGRRKRCPAGTRYDKEREQCVPIKKKARKRNRDDD